MPSSRPSMPVARAIARWRWLLVASLPALASSYLSCSPSPHRCIMSAPSVSTRFIHQPLPARSLPRVMMRSSAQDPKTRDATTRNLPNWLQGAEDAATGNPGDKSSPLIKTLYIVAWFLQTLPPAAAISLLASGLIEDFALPIGLSLYIAAEAMYYVLSLASSRSRMLKPLTLVSGQASNEIASSSAAATAEERLSTWARCLADKTTDAEALITGWFYKKSHALNGEQELVKLADLHEGNVREWLAWSVCGRDDGGAADSEELDEALAMLEAALSTRRQPFTFRPGFSPRVVSMRLNADLPSTHIKPRPLFYYAVTDGLLGGLVTPHKMRSRGFTYHVADGLTYWYHPGSPTTCPDSPPRDTPARTPLVFVHGVGLGPLPYVSFINQLTAQSAGPTMIIELPFVAQRLSGLFKNPQHDSTVQAIECSMARHGINSATFVGHSLGTVYLSWVAQQRPALMASCVFIDPIVFLLHQPKVAHQFLYAKPKTTLSAVEHYFIKSEHSIVSYFHRHFFWQDILLWAKDVAHCSTHVVLSREDAIVPVESVQRYLRHTRCKTTVLEGARHGDFLTRPEMRSAVLEIVQTAQRKGWRRKVRLDQRANRKPTLVRRIRRLYVNSPLPSSWPPALFVSSPLSKARRAVRRVEHRRDRQALKELQATGYSEQGQALKERQALNSGVKELQGV